MKLIFIDIDGVLNSSLSKGPYISDMEVEKLLLLRKLINESGAYGVVITSDRRYSQIDMTDKMKAFDEYEIYVVDEIRKPNEKDPEDNRGKQIMDYLTTTKDRIDKIAILDDIDDGISEIFHEDFVQVNRLYGLNEEVFTKTIELLK